MTRRDKLREVPEVDHMSNMRYAMDGPRGALRSQGSKTVDVRPNPPVIPPPAKPRSPKPARAAVQQPAKRAR